MSRLKLHIIHRGSQDFQFVRVWCDIATKALDPLHREYPNFDLWLTRKAISGLWERKRCFVLALIDDEFAGIAILKKTPQERKICTLRVASKFRSIGVGTDLLRNSLKLLDTDTPTITVSAERHHQFEHLLTSHGFKLQQVVDDYYRLNSKEYVYNGKLFARKTHPLDINIENSQPKETSRLTQVSHPVIASAQLACNAQLPLQIH